jgi:glutaredoxin
MKSKLLLYSRADCGLCAEMKAIIRRVGATRPLVLKEVDIDTVPELRERYGDEVPVLFIDGRKAFKCRLTAAQLEKKLKKTIVSVE